MAVTPDGTKAYVSNIGNVDGTTVSVINATNDTVIKTITVGVVPEGVAVTPDGGKVYVANSDSNSESVISTTTDTVIATIPGDCGLLFVPREAWRSLPMATRSMSPTITVKPIPCL